MASEVPVAVTTVTDRYAVAIPSVIRSRLDIEPGDELRWLLDDDGNLSVDVGTTDAVEIERGFGNE